MKVDTQVSGFGIKQMTMLIHLLENQGNTGTDQSLKVLHNKNIVLVPFSKHNSKLKKKTLIGNDMSNQALTLMTTYTDLF